MRSFNSLPIEKGSMRLDASGQHPCSEISNSFYLEHITLLTPALCIGGQCRLEMLDQLCRADKTVSAQHQHAEHGKQLVHVLVGVAHHLEIVLNFRRATMRAAKVMACWFFACETVLSVIRMRCRGNRRPWTWQMRCTWSSTWLRTSRKAFDP